MLPLSNEKGRLRGPFLLGAVIALAILSFPASPQEPGAGRRLAATCAGCHGTDGHSVTTSPGPIAGLQKEALLAQLRAYRDGSTASTVMGQLVRGYTDEQLQAIASYLAGAKK